ncbi:MAG: class II aldolase/adducin family protein [Streptosporangiaceae bacterium]
MREGPGGIATKGPGRGPTDGLQEETGGLREELAEAARVLSALGLVTAYGHVSARTGDVMLITPAADLAAVTADRIVTVPLDTGAPGAGVPDSGAPGTGAPGTLPAGAPAEGWAHLALYRARPDAGAIARAQPPSAFAAAAGATALPPLYGQAAWLGEAVPVHDSAELLRSAELADRAARSLPAGEALLLRGNGALTLGAAPGLAAARMWLLSAACDSFVSARAAGPVTPLSPAEIASWRAVSGELLPRLWQHLRGRATPHNAPLR